MLMNMGLRSRNYSQCAKRFKCVCVRVSAIGGGGVAGGGISHTAFSCVRMFSTCKLC